MSNTCPYCLRSYAHLTIDGSCPHCFARQGVPETPGSIPAPPATPLGAQPPTPLGAAPQRDAHGPLKAGVVFESGRERQPLFDQIQAHIDKSVAVAVAAERERCAAIVRNWGTVNSPRAEIAA